MAVSANKLKDLLLPFPVQWKIKQYTDYNKAICVPYVPVELIQVKLDQILGADNWSLSFKSIGAHTFAVLAVNVEGSGWVEKMDTGSGGAVTKTKTEGDVLKAMTSDALKRVAKLWGLGRFARGIRNVSLDTKPNERNPKYPKIFTSSGAPLNLSDISGYINKNFAADICADTAKFLEGTLSLEGEEEQSEKAFIDTINSLLETSKKWNHQVIKDFLVKKLELPEETELTELSSEHQTALIEAIKASRVKKDK